jgi:hypothetical protein
MVHETDRRIVARARMGARESFITNERLAAVQERPEDALRECQHRQGGESRRQAGGFARRHRLLQYQNAERGGDQKPICPIGTSTLAGPSAMAYSMNRNAQISTIVAAPACFQVAHGKSIAPSTTRTNAVAGW